MIARLRRPMCRSRRRPGEATMKRGQPSGLSFASHQRPPRGADAMFSSFCPGPQCELRSICCKSEGMLGNQQVASNCIDAKFQLRILHANREHVHVGMTALQISQMQKRKAARSRRRREILLLRFVSQCFCDTAPVLTKRVDAFLSYFINHSQ